MLLQKCLLKTQSVTLLIILSRSDTYRYHPILSYQSLYNLCKCNLGPMGGVAAEHSLINVKTTES